MTQLAALLVLGALGYAGVALGYARYLYMRERARIVEDEWRRHPDEDPAKRFLAYSHAPIACAAFVSGLGWPVLLPGLLVLRAVAAAVTGRPQPSPAERGYRRRRARRRIAELEAELGLARMPGGATPSGGASPTRLTPVPRPPVTRAQGSAAGRARQPARGFTVPDEATRTEPDQRRRDGAA